ncbi:hypothetical protein NicSoilE8_34960 [Arthrobacter sp. NicSoilE8]|nr:hypothetical protein NicSoilE8_34960 [Arthrobacter sp. NicSoilE8]
MGSGRPGHGWHAIGERRGGCLRTGTERTVRVRSPDADRTRRWTRAFRAAVGSPHLNDNSHPVTQTDCNSHPNPQADCNSRPDPHKGNGTQCNSNADADRHSPNADEPPDALPRQDPQRRRQR